MIGLLGLLILTAVGFLIYLGYKLPRKYFKSKVAGIIGGLIVFCIFFGDHVYLYGKHRYLCLSESKREIFDIEVYNFVRNSLEKQKWSGWRYETKDSVGKIFNGRYDTDGMVSNDLKYIVYANSVDSSLWKRGIIDTINNKSIFYAEDFFTRGGWFFYFIDPSDTGVNFDCKTF